MSVKIIVDSTTDLSPEITDKVTVVPITICFGSTAYTDGIDITNKEFYEKLIENDVLPTTSQPSPDLFEKAFREIKDNGDTAVVITISSNLSGTLQSANIALEAYEDIINIVDSGSVAIGAGILVEYALKLVDEGKTATEIAHELNNIKDKIYLVALLDTLEYLKKGGRISATAAIAGSFLSIKPVINVVDGIINTLGKARGSKQGNNLLVKEIENAGGVDFSKPVLLGYTGLSDVLLKKYIEDSGYLWEGSLNSLNTTIIGSAIGVHAGPGAVAVAFFKK
ncbi:MAG: DegV family protein [Ruminococcaceae bacterium]|nr:DegV family protein [Oscillospiraceae bacterium]